MIKYIRVLILFSICMLSGNVHAQSYASASAQLVAPVTTTSNIAGVTRTLIAYPEQSKSILSYYVGIDTDKIDFEKFNAIVNRKDYNEIYNEVSTLHNNREAFNNGTFSNVSYYKVEAPISTTGSGLNTGSSFISSADFYTGAVVLAAAGGIAAASGGGGGGSHNSGGSSGSGDDTFNRDALPDLVSPSTFVDTEFLAYPLNALQLENAQYAYAKGLDGAGVKIGFYDSFSDDLTSSTELGSRVVYRDLNAAADCTEFPGECDHGDLVMGYAANARDGSGTQGVAYQASLMMESYNAGTIRTLADNGAQIINLSCGNCATVADLQYVTDKNILVTISTGNTGGADPTAPAIYASQFGGSVLAVTGVVDVAGVHTPYVYEHCGTQADFCLAAYSDQGTSFTAPQVAGAAAIIKQGWNYLTAKQIGQILLDSAQDIGAPGVDSVFGHGLLDLKAAVEPIGTLSIINGSGQTTNYTTASIALNQKTPFGDAFSNTKNASGNTVLIDSFGRDFAIKPSENLTVAKSPTLSAEMYNAFGSRKSDVKTLNLSDQFSLQFSQQPNDRGTDDVTSFAEYKVNPDTQVKVAFSTGMSGITQNTAQEFNKSDFISSNIFNNGFLNFSDNNQVFYQEIALNSGKKISTKFSTIYSKNNDGTIFDTFENENDQVTSDYTSTMIESRYAASDDLNFGLKNGVTHEFDSLLGTKFTGAFDMENGADTYFTGADVSYDLTPRWNLFASYDTGMTKTTPSASSSFSDVTNIVSDSFFVTATKSEITGHDKFSFSIGQPTRVKSGSATGLTQNVDHTTGDISVSSFQQSLVPSGRTLLFQAAYDKALSDNINVNFALEYASQPDEQKDQNAETVALMKLSYKFK
jgi:hypothetical protein